MIERRRLPGRGAMANLASLRKPCLHVIGIGRTLKIFQVARHTSGGGQVVVVVGVAIRALPRWHGVHSSEREVHQRVIERRRLPCHGGMTLLAGLGEVGRNVVGIGRPLKILKVAGDAGCARQIVVIVDVAIDALPRRHGVPSRQGEAH